MSINWKHPFWRYVGIALAIVLVIVAGWFLIGRLFPSNPPGPTKNERTADSLAATRPADKALIDSSNARIVNRQPTSDIAIRAATAAQDRANRSKRRADSLAIARAWEGAYNERTAEATDLRVTVANNATEIANLKADTTDMRQQLGIVNRRLATTENVVVGLRWDLEQARQCKIIGLINCPSRIQTVAMTALVYFAADRYQKR